MKLFRNLFISMLIIVALGISIFVFTFDAKRFLPLIYTAAQQQGYSLSVNNIGLALWPELGLKLEGIKLDSLRSPGPNPLVTMDQATLALPLKPLLAGTLQVREISFGDGAINLWQNKVGNNWSAAPVDKEQTDHASPQKTPVRIDKVVVNNVKVQWQDDQQQPIQGTLKQATVETKELNHFAVSMVGQLDARGKMPVIIFELEQGIKKTQAMWRLEQGKGKLGPLGKPLVPFNFHAELPVDLGSVVAGFAVSEFNPTVYLPLMGVSLPNKSPLKSLALRSKVSWEPNALKFTDGALILDGSAINWQLVQLGERWLAAIKAPKVDLDAYLPPVDAGGAASAKKEDAAAKVPGLPAVDMALEIGELKVRGYVINDVNTKIALDSQRIKLLPFTARAFGGALEAQAVVNISARSVQLTGQLDAVGIAMEPLWKQFNPKAQIQLTGTINAKTHWQSSADTIGDLVEHLNGQMQLQGDSVRISPLNITQEYCQIISQATLWKRDKNEWPAFTLLRDLTAELVIAPTQVKFTRLHSRVDKLQVDGEGAWDRQTDQFTLQLPITLLQMADADTTIKGCTIGSEYWVNRQLSLLQCKGLLATLDASRDCGVNKTAVAGLLKDYALYKLKKGEGINVQNMKEKVEEKKVELKEKQAELREKLDEKLGPEQVKKIEDKLKGLLNRE